MKTKKILFNNSIVKIRVIKFHFIHVYDDYRETSIIELIMFRRIILNENDLNI